MSRTLPLSYVRPVGGAVAPGGFLTCVGGRGDIGQWVADPSAELIDPTAANTVATLATKHNELVWLYGLTRILTVQPRLYFSTAGDQGIQFFRDGVATNGGLPYAPYSAIVAPYPSITMADFLAGINMALGSDPSRAEFVYDGSRINLLFKSGLWQISEPLGSYYGAAKRMLNRIFNRTDADTTILDSPATPHTFTAPALIQGAPLSGPIFGVFPVPAAVTGLQTGNRTTSSFDISWTPNPDASGYYVYAHAQSPSFNKSWYVTDQTKTLRISDGLQVGVQYTITVAASTPYEINVGNLTVQNHILITAPFGPISNGIQRTTDSVHLYSEPEGDLGVNYYMYGFGVSASSAWIGTTFNAVSFPLMQPSNLGLISGNGPLYVDVYSRNPWEPDQMGSPLVATGSVNIVSNPADSYTAAYTVHLNTSVTLAENMFIIFSSEAAGINMITFNNSSGAVPLTTYSIFMSDATMTGIPYAIFFDTPSGILCDFLLV